MDAEKGLIDWGVILAELEAKKAALEQSIASIRTAINLGVLGGTAAAVGFTVMEAGFDVPSSGSSSVVDLPAGAFLGKSVPVAIVAYLEAARSKKTAHEIAIALRDGGIESSSGNFDNVVIGALHRLKKAETVLRFKDGWGLSKWYPAGLRGNGSASPKKRRPKKKINKKTIQTSDAALLKILRSNPNLALRPRELADLSGLPPLVIEDFIFRQTKAGTIAESPEGFFGVPRK